MTSVNKTNASFIFCVCLLCLVLLTFCSGSPKSQKQEQPQLKQKTDSSFIFNGISLEGWEITNFGPQGPVYVSGDEIILSAGDGCTGITYKKFFPALNYEVSLDAMKVDGNDFFCGITFPVGKDPCSLIIGGWGGAVVGLSSINGMDASENSTTTLMKFESKQWYHICLTVKESNIKALIDTITVVDFTIGNNKLSIRPEVELSKPFGIASWRTTAALKNIKVRKIE
jgi:hypothetical protein